MQHVLVGTFCFPFGPEFGCGISRTVDDSTNLNVSAGFGVGKGPNRVSIRVGASHTVRESVTFRSGRCESGWLSAG